MKRKMSKRKNLIIAITISGALFFLLFVVVDLSFILTLVTTLASYSLIFYLLQTTYDRKSNSWADEDLLEYLVEKVKDLEHLRDNLSGTLIDQKVDHLMAISSDILLFLRRSPKEIYRANTFIVDVLPAALVVLNEYVQFHANYCNNNSVSSGLSNIEQNLDPIIKEFDDSYSWIIEGRFSEIQRTLDITNGHEAAGHNSVDFLRAKYQM